MPPSSWSLSPCIDPRSSHAQNHSKVQVLAVICSKTGRSAEILRCSHPVRPHRRGGAELDGGAFLRSPTSTLVDLFAPRRYQVSHRVHTLLSRLAPEPDRLRRIEEARRTGRSQPVAEVYSGRSRRVAAVCLDAAVLRHVAEVETRHPELSRHAEDLPKEGTIED
jgi:hypothetical protein